MLIVLCARCGVGEGSKAKGRSRKWKEMLKFPGVAQAMSLDREIS